MPEGYIGSAQSSLVAAIISTIRVKAGASENANAIEVGGSILQQPRADTRKAEAAASKAQLKLHSGGTWW